MARGERSTSAFVVAFKAACIAAMVCTPLFGVWIASSLAAFANRATWLPVVCGLLLFPGLPLAWDGFAALRLRGVAGGAKRRFLTFSDRLILRTLAINVFFLVVLLAAFPSRAFVALSTRGDWMLDGHHGAAAERTRSALLGCAGGLEWLYRASRDNPYRQEGSDDASPQPTPVPTASAAPAPLPAASAEAPPSPMPTTTPSPTYPWPATLHPVVANMPKEVEVSIESVGKYIQEREPDPMSRVKALHDWVADRVAYDAPAYAARNIPREAGDAQHVFRSRVGVCAGYAKLLAALGKVTGDEILYVVGDARSQDAPMEGESHAWNAARIGAAWYLIDATWNAGSVNGASFQKRYQTEYLFTPPELFAVTHFPDAPKWQLLERPLSRVEFFRRPVLAPAFFAHGLELVAPDRSQVTTAGSIELSIKNPRGVFLLADYAPKTGGARVECAGNRHTTMRCDFPAAGTYDVRLYANHERYGTYAYAGAVQVNARP
ncbi:MAG: hypothetical protein KF819_35075 [Labilithrix sp.]|nr:hypothetical protein [Labilithrix sp.]